MSSREWWDQFEAMFNAIQDISFTDAVSMQPIIAKIFDFKQAIHYGVSPRIMAEIVLAFMEREGWQVKYPGL
jgi:hypothetical protein